MSLFDIFRRESKALMAYKYNISDTRQRVLALENAVRELTESYFQLENLLADRTAALLRERKKLVGVMMRLNEVEKVVADLSLGYELPRMAEPLGPQPDPILGWGDWC